MGQFRTSRRFDIIFLIVLSGLVWIAFVNRIAIGDWIYFLGYQPDARTAQTATDAGLSDQGRRLLYRTNPQYASKDTITAECDLERLACITAKGQVFILDDPSKPTQTVVSAAHETLHLAYRRLSETKKQELAPLLDQAIELNNTAISSELVGQTTPDDRRDEAHSLLGTEYANLPTKLETYYQTYFNDRSKVVALEAASAQ